MYGFCLEVFGALSGLCHSGLVFKKICRGGMGGWEVVLDCILLWIDVGGGCKQRSKGLNDPTAEQGS